MQFGSWNTPTVQQAPFASPSVSFGNPSGFTNPPAGFTGNFANTGNAARPFVGATNFNAPAPTFGGQTGSNWGQPAPANQFTGGTGFNSAPSNFVTPSFGNQTGAAPGFGMSAAPSFSTGTFMSNPTIGQANNPGFSQPFNANSGFPQQNLGFNSGFTSAAQTYNSSFAPANTNFGPTATNSALNPGFAGNTSFTAASQPFVNNNLAGGFANSAFSSNMAASSFQSTPFNQNMPLRFKATTIKEDTSNLTIVNLCGMPELTGKSIEEQRLQDYKMRGPNPSALTFNTGLSSSMSTALSGPSAFTNPINLGPQSGSLFSKPNEIKPQTSLFPTANTGSLFTPQSSLFPSTSAGSLFSNPNSAAIPLTGQPSSLFPTSTPSLFSNPQLSQSNPAASLFQSNPAQPTSLFNSTPLMNQPNLFSPKPQQMPFTTNTQTPDFTSAFRDPHGLSWLFADTIPSNIAKSYNQRTTQITEEPTSVLERIVKPKRINNYPQVLTEKWKNSQEKKYLKGNNSFDLLSQKKSEPFFVAKRPSFMNLKLEEYKDDDNNKYFKMPGGSPVKSMPTEEISILIHNPELTKVILSIHKEMTIFEIKKQVLRYLPEADDSGLQLVYKSNILNDNETIRSAGIASGSELTVLNAPIMPKVKRNMPTDDLLPIIPQGYKTKPSLAEMARMTVEELQKVRNFTVENEFGKLVFEGSTNLLGMNLAEIIKINHKEVIGYPDDSDVIKPEVGQGLNKPAVLTLYRFDVSGPKEKIEHKLKAMCQKANMEFQSFNQESEELIVKIKHF